MSVPIPPDRLRPAPVPGTATDLYDTLSEALRTRPRHAGEAYAVLHEADRLLSLLDAHLRAGGPLPEPWRTAGGRRER